MTQENKNPVVHLAAHLAARGEAERAAMIEAAGQQREDGAWRGWRQFVVEFAAEHPLLVLLSPGAGALYVLTLVKIFGA